MSSTVVARWNAVALQAVRDARPGPPIAARALAVLHTAIYDAWATYHPVAVGTRLGDLFRRPRIEHTLPNKTVAVSYAAYYTLQDLFPGQSAVFANFMTELGYDPSDTTSTPGRIGREAAQAVVAYRHGDGANQLGDLHPGPYSDYTGYIPANDPDRVNDPNAWQPLRLPSAQGGRTVQQCVTPHWGLVTPFALNSGGQFRHMSAPATYPSKAYDVQAHEVLDYSARLTDEQKVIAEYWSDGPGSELPPGHWCLFAQFVSERDAHNLDQDVELFFILGNALLDASIVAWDAKRFYNSVRPVTAIRYLFRGQQVSAWGGPQQGTRLIDGKDWQPYQPAALVTPPFPEYVSGHSTFSAAAAEVLRRFTGSDHFGGSHTYPAGQSRVEPGAVPAHDVTLYWATFSEAADQAGLSRRYGGIHFVQADLMGRAMGRLVAAQVWDKARSYITGSALGKEHEMSGIPGEQGDRISYERGLPPPPRLLPLGELRPIVEPAFRDQAPPQTKEEVEEWERFPSSPVEHMLTDELAQHAEAVALASPDVKRLLAGKRYIPIGATLMDEGDEKPEGEARAQAGTLIFMIYNYTDNVPVQVILDRDARGVRSVAEQVMGPACPAPPREIETAIALAREDQRLAERLTEDMEGTAIMVTVEDPAHPLYRHRLLDVRFGYPDERLPRHMALVDLSTERVVRAGPVAGVQRAPMGRE